MAGEVRIETVVQLINSVRLDRLVLLIRHNAKPQTVMRQQSGPATQRQPDARMTRTQKTKFTFRQAETPIDQNPWSSVILFFVMYADARTVQK